MGTSVAVPGTDLEGIRGDVAADGDPASLGERAQVAVPPKRVPVPESKMPPNGTFASSSTVCSLMCTMPVGIFRARSRPRITSFVKVPRDSPYSADAAELTAGCILDEEAHLEAQARLAQLPEQAVDEARALVTGNSCTISSLSFAHRDRNG